MAQWPVAYYGDERDNPRYPHRVRRQPPPTLITEYEDGQETRRLKGGSERRIFDQDWVVVKNHLDAMLDFWESVGLFTSFTFVTFDANESVGTECDVRFREPPSYNYVANNLYEVETSFIEVIGE